MIGDHIAANKGIMGES